MYPRITLIISLFIISLSGGAIIDVNVDNFWDVVYDPTKTVIVLYTSTSPMCWLCRPVESAFEVAHDNHATDAELVWARSQMKKTDLRKAGVSDFEVFGWPKVIAYPQIRKHKHLFLMGEFRNPARYDDWIPLIKQGKNYPRQNRFERDYFITGKNDMYYNITSGFSTCCKNWYY